MIRRPPLSPLFPTRRSSDLPVWCAVPFRIGEHVGAGVIRAEETFAPLVGGHFRGAGRIRLHPRFAGEDRKSTRLNSSHVEISYAVFCLKKKRDITRSQRFYN